MKCWLEREGNGGGGEEVIAVTRSTLEIFEFFFLTTNTVFEVDETIIFDNCRFRVVHILNG